MILTSVALSLIFTISICHQPLSAFISPPFQCCFGKHDNFSISISFSINDNFILVLVLVLVKFNYNFSFSISLSNQKSNNISSSFSFSFSFSFSGRLFKYVEANACICQKNFPF